MKVRGFYFTICRSRVKARGDKQYNLNFYYFISYLACLTMVDGLRLTRISVPMSTTVIQRYCGSFRRQVFSFSDLSSMMKFFTTAQFLCEMRFTFERWFSVLLRHKNSSSGVMKQWLLSSSESHFNSSLLRFEVYAQTRFQWSPYDIPANINDTTETLK